MPNEIDSHYVSRDITKPWEIGQRFLKYYDYENSTIGEQSSRSLFVSAGLLSEESETKFNRLIESPITAVRSNIEADHEYVPNWKRKY